MKRTRIGSVSDVCKQTGHLTSFLDVTIEAVEPGHVQLRVESPTETVFTCVGTHSSMCFLATRLNAWLVLNEPDWRRGMIKYSDEGDGLLHDKIHVDGPIRIAKVTRVTEEEK